MHFFQKKNAILAQFYMIWEYVSYWKNRGKEYNRS